MTQGPNQPTDDWDPGGFDIDDVPANPQAAYAPRTSRHRHKADDRLVVSILLMLFCCQPLGIVAVVFSAMTMSANNSGDYDQAHRHAKLARTFGAWALGLGLAYFVLVFLYVVIMIAATA